MNKFWKMYIPIVIVLCVIFIIRFYSIQDNSVDIKSDYYKFNDSENYVNVNINPNIFKTINENELKDMLSNKTGIILIGSATNNNSRVAISILNDAIMQTSIPNVYYFDNKDLNKDLNDYILSKLKDKNITTLDTATIIFVNLGNVEYVIKEEASLELSSEEKEQKKKDYLKYINSFVDSCNEAC